MNLIRKIIGSLALAGIILMPIAPAAHAQSVLDDIKARLESEGIAVIDYSSPEGAWGSLPGEWSNYLGNKGYANLKALADELKDDFVEREDSITALRREMIRLESEKSRITDQKELEAIQLEIDKLEEEIEKKEVGIKAAIGSIIGSPDLFSGLMGQEEQGKNLIFEEIDFYFNYSKWGRLPLRIIAALEEEGYTSLQNLMDEWESEEFHPLDLETTLTEIEGIDADDAALIVNSVQILQAPGERQATEILRSVANVLKNLIIGLAVIWIIYAGARLLFAGGDESVITEQKRSLIYAGIGLVAILLVDRGVDLLYGPAGVERTELYRDEGFRTEVYGLVNFIKAIIGTVAIVFIIVSGIRMLLATGEEDVITRQKKSLLWVGAGIILILIDQVIVENVFIIPTQQSDQIKASNVTSIINTIGSVLQFLLGFVGLIALGILIYGAATMVLNYGNDEMVQKAKKIIRNAIIGILVIISAYVIVATLVVFR